MTAKKKEDLAQHHPPETGQEQFESLKRKGAFGMWKDLIPEDADVYEMVRQHRKTMIRHRGST